ncbi:MAG: hypothetical protein AAF664_15390 [Planctomycetota bacterium]
MSRSMHRDDRHLTDNEIVDLLGEQADPKLVDWAYRHLDECEYCQRRLEAYASSPNDWKRFIHYMQDSDRHRATTTSGPTGDADQIWQVSEPDLKSRLDLSPAVAFAIVLSIALLGAWCRSPQLFDGRRAPPLQQPSNAPKVPLAPDSAPVPPSPGKSERGKSLLPTENLESVQKQLQEIKEDG